LKEYIIRFNHEVVLFPNLQDGVAYMAFLNGLLPGRFKFSLAESKVTTFTEAQRRPQDFIQAIKICARDNFVQLYNRKRGGDDKDPPADKLPRKDDEIIDRFLTTPWSILMETKGNPMLRRSKPIDTPAKFINKNKYFKYHEDRGHATSKCHELDSSITS